MDRGEDPIIFVNACIWNESLPPSEAWGTISDRNSISSVDNAREFLRSASSCGFERENLLRNRETAEGGGGVGSGKSGASDDEIDVVSSAGMICGSVVGCGVRGSD